MLNWIKNMLNWIKNWFLIGENIKEIKTDNKEIKNKFNRFITDFFAKGTEKQNPSDYLIKASPLKLTKKGIELAKDSGITDYLNRNFDSYKSKIEAKSVVLVVDNIRNLTSSLFFKSKDNEITKIREYFYNRGISSLLMEEIFTIQLRDKYLEFKTKK